MSIGTLLFLAFLCFSLSELLLFCPYALWLDFTSLQRTAQKARRRGAQTLKGRKQLRHSLTILGIFLILSAISIAISGAPIRVHAVDIAALFVAFAAPGLTALNKETKTQLYIWLLGAVIGLFVWDVLSACVIVKREIFIGWYIIYPIGMLGLVLLQVAIKYINAKLPYNKAYQPKPESGPA